MTNPNTIYVVEPEVFTIGQVTDNDAVLTDNLNTIINGGSGTVPVYGFYPESLTVTGTVVRGVFSKI